jgi:hypothetical protein
MTTEGSSLSTTPSLQQEIPFTFSAVMCLSPDVFQHLLTLLGGGDGISLHMTLRQVSKVGERLLRERVGSVRLLVEWKAETFGLSEVGRSFLSKISGYPLHDISRTVDLTLRVLLTIDDPTYFPTVMFALEDTLTNSWFLRVGEGNSSPLPLRKVFLFLLHVISSTDMDLWYSLTSEHLDALRSVLSTLNPLEVAVVKTLLRHNRMRLGVTEYLRGLRGLAHNLTTQEEVEEQPLWYLEVICLTLCSFCGYYPTYPWLALFTVVTTSHCEIQTFSKGMGVKTFLWERCEQPGEDPEAACLLKEVL